MNTDQDGYYVWSNDKIIGFVWQTVYGTTWCAEYDKTGMSWSGFQTRQEAKNHLIQMDTEV